MKPATELTLIGPSSANEANRIKEVSEVAGTEVAALVDETGAAYGWIDERYRARIEALAAELEEAEYKLSELYESAGRTLAGIVDYGDYAEAGDVVRSALIELVADACHNGKTREALRTIEERF